MPTRFRSEKSRRSFGAAVYLWNKSASSDALFAFGVLRIRISQDFFRIDPRQRLAVGEPETSVRSLDGNRKRSRLNNSSSARRSRSRFCLKSSIQNLTVSIVWRVSVFRSLSPAGDFSAIFSAAARLMILIFINSLPRFFLKVYSNAVPEGFRRPPPPRYSFASKRLSSKRTGLSRLRSRIGNDVGSPPASIFRQTLSPVRRAESALPAIG